MTDDLVKRLRDKNCCDATKCNCDEAADRIDQLEREIARKDAALGHIYAWYPISVTQPRQTIDDIREFAKAALGEKKDG